MVQTLQYSNMNNAEAFSTLSADTISFALAADNVLVSGVSKKRILVYRIWFVCSGATTLTFKDGITTSLSGAFSMLANGSFVLDLSNLPWFQTSVGKDLVLTSSNAIQVSGMIYYQVN